MDDSAFEEGSSAERKHNRPAQYSPQACTFCQKRHIKCDSQNPCFQCSRRGIECDYKEPMAKRGPKPGIPREIRPRSASRHVNKLIAEVEKQKQLAEYWRRNYSQLQEFALEQGITLPQLVGAKLPTPDTLADAIDASQAEVASAKSPIASDAVSAFFQCIQLAIPNNFQHNQDVIAEWWLLLSSGDPPPQLTTEKLVEGFAHACVFAHGCRLRGSEDRAQFFGDRAESLLQAILDSDASALDNSEIANGVLSGILLHIAFQGALPNAEIILSSLNTGVKIIDTFAAKQRLHELDDVLVQRVYAQMVGIQQTPEERWKYLNLALNKETPVQAEDLRRRAFSISNKSILALVLSNSINWFSPDDPNDQEARASHITQVLKFLEDLEINLSQFEVLCRSNGPNYYSESLTAGYRVIVYSTRASIFTAQKKENDSVIWFAKTIEAAKILRDSVQVPLLATALSLLYAIRLLQQMNKPNLLADGLSVLERVIKYYPALFMPWKILSGQITTTLSPGGPFGTLSPSNRDAGTPVWLRDAQFTVSPALQSAKASSAEYDSADDLMDDSFDEDFEDPNFSELPPAKRAKRSQTPPQQRRSISPLPGPSRQRTPSAPDVPPNSQSPAAQTPPSQPPGNQSQSSESQKAQSSVQSDQTQPPSQFSLLSLLATQPPATSEPLKGPPQILPSLQVHSSAQPRQTSTQSPFLTQSPFQAQSYQSRLQLSAHQQAQYAQYQQAAAAAMMRYQVYSTPNGPIYGYAPAQMTHVPPHPAEIQAYYARTGMTGAPTYVPQPAVESYASTGRGQPNTTAIYLQSGASSSYPQPSLVSQQNPPANPPS